MFVSLFRSNQLEFVSVKFDYNHFLLSFRDEILHVGSVPMTLQFHDKYDQTE